MAQIGQFGIAPAVTLTGPKRQIEASLLSRAFSGFLQGCWRTGRCASAQGS
jgi:phosphotransferase system  glucose/maltose/N-acetylglucosamine-specific IIC component